MELCLHYPNTPSWSGAQLKHRDNFTFTILLFFITMTTIGLLLGSLRHVII